MKNKSTMKRVLTYVSHYKASLVFLILFSFFFAVLSLCIPVLVGRAIDVCVDAGQVDFDKVFETLVLIGIIAVFICLFQWLTNVIGNKITFGVVGDVRKDAFEKVSKLPLSYVDSHAHGSVINTIISDAEQFADGLFMSFTQLFVGITTIVGTLVFMLFLNVYITIAVVVLTPISLVLTSFITKRTFSMFTKQSEARANMTSAVDEYIGEGKTVQAFNFEEKAFEKFKKANNELQKASLRAVFFSSLVNPSTRVINNVVYAVVTFLGALAVILNSMTIGGLTCFLSYAGQYAKPFNEISGIFGEMQNCLACAKRIFDLIDEKEIVESGEKVLEDPQGDIVFSNVSFSYDKDRPLIDNLNVVARSGMRVAIVGPTGCGKTTLINLLMRFYDTLDGEIRVDGDSIKDITFKSLRSNIGMVLQDTWIKSGTVRENIALGKPNASFDEIVSAAKASHAHNFIKKLPLGYDTVISNDSGDLSQGERQLLCISRVMLKNPNILILDEATSSIDTRTEMKIQDAFSNLMRGKTSFIVAHRLSTIKNADLILVMKNGKVIEKGTHAQLIKMQGFYYELYNSGKPQTR